LGNPFNILGKNAKFGEKRQNFDFLNNFGSNFENPCDYHESVTKFLEIL